MNNTIYVGSPTTGVAVIEFGYPGAWGSRTLQNWGPAGSGNVSANSFVGPLTGHEPADLALAGGTWLGRSVALYTSVAIS